MSNEVIEKETTDLLERWSKAELSGDPAAIGPFLDENYVGIGPFGFTLTKEEWLQRHESGDLKYSQFTLVDLQLRVYGDTVLVIGVQDAVATYQGNPVPGGKLRFSATIVKGAVAGFQLSQMGPPPGMPPGGPRPS
jgi:ketosteroid isomerase-like protein